MTDYNWQEVSMSIIETEPATYHKWVWFWQVGFYRRSGWQTEDRRGLKVQVWREWSLADHILAQPSPLQSLIDDAPRDYGGIDRRPSAFWKNRT